MQRLGTLLCVVLALAVGQADRAAAQTGPEVSFSLFTLEGWQVRREFAFDQSYTERFGLPVPVPFRIEVPQNEAIFMIADGQPDGGAFVKFTFGIEAEDPADRVFLENIQIVTATIPMFEESDDPGQTRVLAAAQLLRDQIFPQAVAGFEAPEVLALEEIAIGSVDRAVQLIGRYVDPNVGPMMVRLVMFPHPDQPESLFAVANINLALAPVTDAATLRATVTGQMLSSFTYP